MLSEGGWLYSAGLYVKVSLGKILNSKLLLTCWLAPCMAATTMYVCMNYCKSHWTKVSAKCPKMEIQHTFKKKQTNKQTKKNCKINARLTGWLSLLYVKSKTRLYQWLQLKSYFNDNSENSTHSHNFHRNTAFG